MNILAAIVSICVRQGTSAEAPRQKACPLKADIPRYRLVADGKLADAASVIRKETFRPSAGAHALISANFNAR